jgi:hypothetical protein
VSQGVPGGSTVPLSFVSNFLQQKHCLQNNLSEVCDNLYESCECFKPHTPVVEASLLRTPASFSDSFVTRCVSPHIPSHSDWLRRTPGDSQGPSSRRTGGADTEVMLRHPTGPRPGTPVQNTRLIGCIVVKILFSLQNSIRLGKPDVRHLVRHAAYFSSLPQRPNA